MRYDISSESLVNIKLIDLENFHEQLIESKLNETGEHEYDISLSNINVNAFRIKIESGNIQYQTSTILKQ